MDSAAQRAADAFGHSPIPDLRDIPLGELARQAADGRHLADDVAARIVPDGAVPSVAATTFSSSII